MFKINLSSDNKEAFQKHQVNKNCLFARKYLSKIFFVGKRKIYGGVSIKIQEILKLPSEH